MSYDTEDKKCCGKKKYRTPAKAEAALKRWREMRGVSGPTRYYRCENGYYHLTHMPKSTYRKISKPRPCNDDERAKRRERMRQVINRDKVCVICGEQGGIVSAVSRVRICPFNEDDLSSYITVHHDCRYGALTSDELFNNGWKLDAHMIREAWKYPVRVNSEPKGWVYLNPDGTTTPAQGRTKRHCL